MKNVIGIDLGTTNCCVAIVDENGRPRVIEDEKGYNILPSYIALKGSNKFVVGHGAKAQAISNPANTLRAVKRLIGRKINAPEVEEARKRVGFEIVEGPNQEVLLRMGDVTLSPIDASSILLKCIKGIAEKHLGREVSEAVITCPAYFTNAQRKATIEAGQKAGLKVMRLLNEPTAAALAYGFRKELAKKILVYDLGGGTFDVSVLEIGNNVYEVLATNGDSYLGGEDFDNRVVDYLAANFKTLHRVDLRSDRVALQRLKDAAERAKCELSFVDRTQIMIPHVHNTVNLQTELTRETLEKLVEDLVQRTLGVVNKTLEEANLKPNEINDVLLVGGQTRMPRIQELIKSTFGKAPSKGVHPDEAVAVGAAVQASALTEDKGEILLLDVTPFSLGIDSAGDVFTRIVSKNSVIPVSESRTFTTVMDNQEKVKIVVRQGESKKASDNAFLGEFVLSGIRRAPKMEPKIDVTFRIDFNGILNVSAKDRFTGERQSIMIKDYFERATNPHYEAPPEILAERPPQPVPPDDGNGVAPTSENGSGEIKSKGLFRRLVEGLGRKKEAPAPVVAEAEPPVEGIAPLEPEPLPPSAPVPGNPGSDLFGHMPSAVSVSPIASVPPMAAPSPVAITPPPASAPPPPVTPTWESDPFNHLPQGKPFTSQYTDPFGQNNRSAAAASSLDPYGVMEKGAPDPFGSTPREQDPFGVVEKAAGGAADPFGVVEKGAGRTRGDTFRVPTLDPFAVVEKPAASPFGRTPTSSDPFGIGDTPAFSNARNPSAGADLLGSLDIDKLVDELAEGIPTVSRPISPATSAPMKATLAEQSPVSGWQSPPGLSNGLEDALGGSFERTKASFGRSAGLGAPPSAPGMSEATHPGVRGTAMHRSGTLPGGLAEEPQLPSGFVDERPNLPSGFVPDQTATVDANRSDAPKKKPARLKIAYKRTDAFVAEYSENLSRGGTFIKTPSPLELGRECIFELSIPDREAPIQLRGQVVWSSKGVKQLEAGQEPGMGIKYLFETPEVRRELETLLEQLRLI